MRKILLGTTAVVGAALMGITVAQAQTAPTVRVGGYFDFSFGSINDTADANRVDLTRGRGQRSRDMTDFRMDSEIHVIVAGKAANGLSYGAVIEFQVDNLGTGQNSGAGTAVDTDEMYMFVSTPTLGRLIVGDEDNAPSLMQVRAPTVTGSGTGGLWADHAESSENNLMGGFNGGSDATKVIYMSPQFAGFDFGVSYAPNGGEGPRTQLGNTAALQRDGTSLRNELAAALRYRGSFGNVGVAAGLGAQTAQPSVNAAAGTPDVTAYNVGLTVAAMGFTVGGEYVFGNYSGASPGRTARPPNRDGSAHYVLGATYTVPGVGVRLGAFYGKATQDNGPGAQDRTQSTYGFGANYTIAPGLLGYATYTSMEDKNRGAIGNPVRNNRSVNAFIVGLNLVF